MSKINITIPSYGDIRLLESSIKKQLSTFLKKNKGVAEADVKLSQGSAAVSDKVCEIYLKTTSKNMFTIQKGASFESSFTKAIDKLQLNSTKLIAGV